ILGLEKNSVKINYKYTYGPGTPFPLDEKPMTDNYIMNIVLQRQSKPSKVEVSYCQGDAFFKNSGKYKIGYTMLEVTGLPKEWVNQANMMNEVWVPSEFNKMTFIQSGVKVPIYTMPLGIDENYFNPHIKPFKKSGKYTFLSVFEWSERKAPEILFNAYSKAFSKKDNVMLICKIANVNSDVNVYEEIEKMNLPEKMADFELLYNVYLQDYDMARLYRTADCFVLPTRGEGWGMPITEAMSCGLPVIATDWSAHKDYMDNSNAYPINVKRLIPAEAKCPYYKGFQWAEPDEEHLIYLMRHVFTQQDESARKGLKAHNEIAAKYTWDHTAKRVIDRIKNI
ncbi:MAG: glycosyltransferase family 4 protein, partial [Candidatus Omnitrophica bacterium]|nr:glycosyltransferase family 4 protein [Candidatus Omnitrophota bacterium]